MPAAPPPKLNRAQIDDILERGYPTYEQLGQFPLGDKLQKLETRAWTRDMRAIDFKPEDMTSMQETIDEREEAQRMVETKDKEIARLRASGRSPSQLETAIKEVVALREAVENLTKSLDTQIRSARKMLPHERISEIYQCHIRNALHGVRLLTTMEDNDKLEERVVLEIDLRKPHILTFHNFLTKMNKQTRKFLRLVALYHDIGKVYHRDRHPVLGKHLLESLNEESRRDFLVLFEKEQDAFYRMLELVGHHDIFGMLCTGEASRASLIDSTSLRLSDLKVAEMLIDGLVVINLGDIYGSIGMIPEERADMIISDWAYFKGILRMAETKSLSKRQIEETIIEDEQEPEKATERIRRLLISMIMYSSRVRVEAGKPSFDRRSLLNGISSYDVVRSALVKQLGSSLTGFCSDFALVCKLDYMLRFLNALADELLDRCTKESKHAPPENGEIDFAAAISPSSVEGIAVILVEILNRLVAGYSDLTRTRDGRRRRIGLELMGLSRSGDIGKRVIELVVDGIRAEGMNWIADEATCWYLS